MGVIIVQGRSAGVDWEANTENHSAGLFVKSNLRNWGRFVSSSSWEFPAAPSTAAAPLAAHHQLLPENFVGRLFTSSKLNVKPVDLGAAPRSQ